MKKNKVAIILLGIVFIGLYYYVDPGINIYLYMCDLDGKNCRKYAKFESFGVCDQVAHLFAVDAKASFFEELNDKGYATAYKATRFFKYQCEK